MAISATGLASLASLLAQQAPTSASPQDAGLNVRTAAIQGSAQSNLMNELAKAAAKKEKREQKKSSLTRGLTTIAGAAIGGPIGGIAGASLGASLGSSVGGLITGTGDPSKTITGTLGKLAGRMMEQPKTVPAPPVTSTPSKLKVPSFQEFSKRFNLGDLEPISAKNPPRNVGGWLITQ